MCNYNLESNIAGADLTALVSSMGYSVWSNYQFRPPLLISALTCLIGNVLYSLAWDLGPSGYTFLVLGRLLTGAGAARVLNRRYIADFVSREYRTQVRVKRTECVAAVILVKSPWNYAFLVLGRLLIKAGAARVLNRRYIADFVSREYRM